MRSTLLTLALLLLTTLLFGDNPLLGTWNMESIGSQTPAKCTFLPDGTYTTENSGRVLTFPYSYDPASNSVALDTPGFGPIKMDISLQEGDLYLTVKKGEKNPFAERMLGLFSMMKDKNRLSQMFFKKLTETFNTALLDTPLFRLYKDLPKD